MKVRWPVVLLLAALGGAGAEGQTRTKSGTTSAQFLKIGVHARVLAMGEASAASATDISAIHFNPAGLSRFAVQEAVFSQVQWLAGTRLFHLAAGWRVGASGVLAVQATTLDYGEMVVRTETHEDGTGEIFTAQDLSIGLAYAHNMTATVSMGAQLKLLSSRIWQMSSRAVAIDVGIVFLTPLEGLRLGMAITNFGTDMRLAGRNVSFQESSGSGGDGQVPAAYELGSWPLPLTFRIGLSGEIQRSGNLGLSWAIDGLHPRDYGEYIDIGAELDFRHRLFLRTGVHGLLLAGGEGGRWALGAGLRHAFSPTLRLKIDYAWADYGRLLPVNMLTVTLGY